MDEKTYIAPDGKTYPVDVERTREGLQLMLGGVRPQTMKDRLEWLQAQPMRFRKPQKPCDIGLFDTESRKQLELFKRMKESASSPAAAEPTQSVPRLAYRSCRPHRLRSARAKDR